MRPVFMSTTTTRSGPPPVSCTATRSAPTLLPTIRVPAPSRNVTPAGPPPAAAPRCTTTTASATTPTTISTPIPIVTAINNRMPFNP